MQKNNKLHQLKITLCAKLLQVLEPDTEKIIGERAATKLEKAKSEFWVALKDINLAIYEFSDGIHEDIGSGQVLKNVRALYRAWKLNDLRIKRAASALQVREQDLVEETKELLNENDELNAVKDAVLPALNSAARAVKKIEKIEKGNENEKQPKTN